MVKKRGKKSSRNLKSKKVSKSSRVQNKTFKKVRSTKRKIFLVLRNLIFFSVLSLLSFVFYLLSSNSLYRSLFQLLAIVLGFVGLAFLIILLALLILKAMKK